MRFFAPCTDNNRRRRKNIFFFARNGVSLSQSSRYTVNIEKKPWKGLVTYQNVRRVQPAGIGGGGGGPTVFVHL
jgi:hypothetical protein